MTEVEVRKIMEFETSAKQSIWSLEAKIKKMNFRPTGFVYVSMFQNLQSLLAIGKFSLVVKICDAIIDDLNEEERAKEDELPYR